MLSVASVISGKLCAFKKKEKQQGFSVFETF